MYQSEWLGYLPFGQYHWDSVNGKDLSAQIDVMDTIRADLKKLIISGHLNEIKRQIYRDGETGPEAVFISYKLGDVAFYSGAL